jgi:hypothetical protein
MKPIRAILSLAAIGLTGSVALAQPLPMQRIPTTDPNGAYCREYQQRVTVGGRPQESYGTACMQPDGSWKILPNEVTQQADVDDIEYIEPPRYVSQPVYVVPPPAYYEPDPYYYRPYSYPYMRSGFNITFGSGGHYRGHHRPYHHFRHHH